MAKVSRALVTVGDGAWEVRELPVPTAPPERGGLLRVEATGLCHSDIDQVHGIVHTPWGGAFPAILGHEIVGRVEALTPEAKAAWGVSEGDRVAVRAPVATPEGTRVYGHDFAVDERSGLFGGAADYLELLPEVQLDRLPDEGQPEELTIWEPLSIAMRWAGPITPGDSVAILGPGHLGLATIVAARAAGASKVFITGTGSDTLRLDAARTLGVDAAIDISQDDPITVVQDLTNGGVDVVVDAASASTATVAQAMQMVRRGGTVVIGGLKDRKPVEGFISDWIPMRGIRIVPGSDGDHVKAAVELLWQGRVPTADLVGEVFTIDDVDDALGLLDRKLPGRDAIRVVLRFDDSPY
jgi:threonine dehydrogenase-like Zn-dependent dehydrogenase